MLDEALQEHEEILKENIDDDEHGESRHIKNLMTELDRKPTEFSFRANSSSSSSSSGSYETPRYDAQGKFIQ